MRTFHHGLTAALLALAALSVHAATTPELRVMGIDRTAPNASQSYEGRDYFRNGVPLSGMVYTNSATGAQLSGGYAPSTFTAGAESSGAASDLAGTVFGAGGLSFRVQDATGGTNNLTPPGYDLLSLNLRLKFLDPRPPESVPGANFEGLLLRNSGFETFTAWDFLIPDPGAAYGIRIDGAVAADGSFQDRLDLRVVTGLGGATSVYFERVLRNGAGDFTRSTLGSVSFGDFFAGDLADVDYIVLGFARERPAQGGNTVVRAGVELLDASLNASADDLAVLAQFEFTANLPTIFSDSDVAQVSARASWLQPTVVAVPEPSTYALMTLGMAALAVLRRRRKA